MDGIEQALGEWKQSLLSKIELAALYSRSPAAHKWKAPFRSLRLRESVAWRAHDLLFQAHTLHNTGHTLGSRILIRSAIETIALLIYLNQLTKSVVAGTENFHLFSQKTSRLLLGSKDKSTKHDSINVLTVLNKADEKYPGVMDMYANLSESAHPNFEGICFGYSLVDHENHTTTFLNNWVEMYGERHVPLMRLCILTFSSEYNEEWSTQFENLEKWILANDARLEATKDDPL